MKLNYKQIRIKLSNKKLQIKASIFVYMQRKNAILLLFSKKKKKKNVCICVDRAKLSFLFTIPFFPVFGYLTVFLFLFVYLSIHIA